MEKTYKVIDGLTETGRVKGAVRDALKIQVEEEFFADWEVQKDGSFTYDLVEDATGQRIKARVKLTISSQDDYKVPGSKKVESDVVIPTLF